MRGGCWSDGAKYSRSAHRLYFKPTGATRYIFDSKRKTPRYAWGKALNLSGGMRIGKPAEPARSPEEPAPAKEER